MHSAHAGIKAALAAVLGFAVSSYLGFTQALAEPSPDLTNLKFIPAPVHAPHPIPLPALPTAVTESGEDAAPGKAGIEDYLERIRAAEESLGPWAEAIAEDALALAGIYRRSGQRREALEVLEKALQVTRVNKGLFDTAQIPIVRQIIDLHIQLEEFEEARRKEQYLFYVQRKNYRGNDPRLLSAIIEWADWNVNMHLQERALGLAQPYIQRERFQPGPPLISPRLQHAKDLYRTALEWMHGSRLEDPRVVTTERKLAALNYVIDQELNAGTLPTGALADDFPSLNTPLNPHSFQFQEGSDALKRAIAYSYNSPNREYGAIAERIMELGDWYLLFDHRTAALETYEEALTVLRASSLSEQEIERIMTPGMPVPIPEIERAEAAGVAPVDYKGYIDVEFRLSRFGLAYSPAVIASSPDSPKAVERELFRTIRDCKFRPRLALGTEGDDDKMRLRYYYTY